jgi:hypothetical protein
VEREGIQVKLHQRSPSQWQTQGGDLEPGQLAISFTPFSPSPLCDFSLQSLQLQGSFSNDYLGLHHPGYDCFDWKPFVSLEEVSSSSH